MAVPGVLGVPLGVPPLGVPTLGVPPGVPVHSDSGEEWGPATLATPGLGMLSLQGLALAPIELVRARFTAFRPPEPEPEPEPPLGSQDAARTRNGESDSDRGESASLERSRLEKWLRRKAGDGEGSHEDGVCGVCCCVCGVWGGSGVAGASGSGVHGDAGPPGPPGPADSACRNASSKQSASNCEPT